MSPTEKLRLWLEARTRNGIPETARLGRWDWPTEEHDLTTADLRQILADWERLRGLCNALQCSFCGHIDQREETREGNAALMLAHMQVCERHPMNKIASDNDALRSLAGELVGALKDCRPITKEMEALLARAAEMVVE